MIGFSGSTFYKLVIKEDGGPNWLGNGILTVTLLSVFVWRCLVFIPEHTVATRKRFNRVVYGANGFPLEYDPLVEVQRRGKTRRLRNLRFRLYLLNSLVLTDCGVRQTPLDTKSVSFGERDHQVELSIKGHVSRDPGNPTKSFLAVASSRWPWRQRNELEELVSREVADAVLRGYDTREAALNLNNEASASGVHKLPLLTIGELGDCAVSLLASYGVVMDQLCYSNRAVSPASRILQGLLDIAAALRGLRGGDKLAEVAAARTTAEAVADNVVDLHRPS
ncbi:MAG TPA: hypothetical protein VF597_00295 [Candidatus Saccharimonadales bacterium]|jgi:hypothetical protein